MSKGMLRGGMVGAGAWSATQLTAWSKTRGAAITALCDRHPERRDPLAARFGIREVYGSVDEMLQTAELDFVDVCTRPYSHVSIINQAVRCGLPILCQKPFCVTLEEAMAAADLCRDAGVRLMVNENFRWQTWCRTIA
ncbi:MAG: Gfo/Idh/MocA family protein, partial [Nitrososphaerales archaeon]